MKTKSFKRYLESRLNKEEIATIKRQAQREIKIFKNLQTTIAEMTQEYMKENNIGFNELARIFSCSPSQLVKIQRAEANLTMSSIANILASMGKDLNDVFKKTS